MPDYFAIAVSHFYKIRFLYVCGIAGAAVFMAAEFVFEAPDKSLRTAITKYLPTFLLLAITAVPGLVLLDMGYDWLNAQSPALTAAVVAGYLLLSATYVATEYGPKVVALLRQQLANRARSAPRPARLLPAGQASLPALTNATNVRSLQLKLRRSQRLGGVLGRKVIFILDARAELSAAEQALVRKYQLGKLVVYDSKARQRRQEAAVAHFDKAAHLDVNPSAVARSWWSNARGLASAAMMALALRITVNGLMRGQHIECKDLDELLGTEAAIRDACENLKSYLDTAQSFDGSEEIVEF
jgi:hypothetical protein